MSRNDLSDSRGDLKDICRVLCTIDSPQQMQDFLTEMLTPSECRDLALRWELMQLLKENVPQRQIAKKLGISLCKITRGAKILKQDHSVSKQYLAADEKDESETPS